MLVRFVAAVLLLVLPAAAQDVRLDAPFDARRLSEVEQRYLQSALAFEGDYVALVDGAWGRGSQGALERWAAREARDGRATWRAVGTLVRRFEAERLASGWVQVWHEDERVGHQLPQGLLEVSETDRELRYVSPDGGLVLLYRLDRDLPLALHDEFRADARAGVDTYRTRSADRLITAGQMRGGRHAYVRSDRTGTRWATHVVLSDDANRGRLRLIAGSFTRRTVPPAELQAGGVLFALQDDVAPEVGPVRPPERTAPRTDDARDLLEVALETLLQRALDRALGGDGDRRAPVAAPDPTPDPAPVPRGGLGFHVNTTDVVTLDSVVAGCGGAVETADGAQARVLLRDGGLGLAVLAVPGRVEGWLPVGRRGAEAGDPVALVADRGGRRGGIVRAEDEGRTLRHDARVEAEAGGAPLLSDRGRVVGVAVPGRGAAVAGPALAGMLRRGGIVHSGQVAPDGSDPGAAVVRLVCG